MAPKRLREQQHRQVNNVALSGVAPEVIAKRTKRHLDELERTNYVEPSIMSIAENDEDAGKFAQGRVRQTISDKRNLSIPGTSPAATKKKSTMNVRTAIIYPKSLAKLIEESGIASLPPSVPTYLTAHSPPSSYPPRMICSVCGYWGRYKCRKCALPYCDMNCEGVHAETRCERRVV